MKKVLLLSMLIIFAFSCSKKDSKEIKKETKGNKKVEVKTEKKTEKKVEKKDEKKEEKKVEKKAATGSDRDKIANFAKKFEDKKIPSSKKWNKYASGFIKMVYLEYGVNLTDVEEKKDEEGKWLSSTEMIYNYLKTNGELFSDKTPKKGDIVFLDNTYDKDKDKEFNDKLTSIGIVIDVDEEGTIYFLYNTSKGVKLKMMNLKHPEQDKIKNKNVTKTINSKMRWLSKKEKAMEGSDKFPTLSSQMLNSFGSILNKHALEDLAYKITLAESDREAIVKFAKTFEDKGMPKSGKWNNYASGFIKMVFLSKRLNLTDVEIKKDEEGKWLSTTQMIFDYVTANGKTHNNSMPKPGDIVFLDNTYDKDKDGEFNDKLTSIGLVTEVDKDGTIYFLYKTSKGVKLKVMNLKTPEQENIKNKNITRTVNSRMRWLSKKEKAMEGSDKFPILSSQMLNSFGSIFK